MPSLADTVSLAAVFVARFDTPPLSLWKCHGLLPISELAMRRFCKTCGSSLAFLYDGSDEVEILFGMVDEEVLRSYVGTELSDSRSHISVENTVKGVSDDLKGLEIQH
ncbi:hypothetical protein BJ878DRAFT_480369 [Calycina marina]|uniref:CENP-V/GFA domain-containing protein n=1 Tax=Calycina marina TaxID=1763456 RepID=A0A9P7Z3J6_9HELO|nr:hypothetical protein BJ878DRAFT_480369 [Calycina marina]